MASSTSSAAVAALVQKASQQYLDCRRKVTAKVEEVKALDQEINALFSQITALGESASASGSSNNKSVGRLEVRIAGVEGETPVENAVITVALDPEYEADDDAFEIVEVQHVIEKHTVTVTAVTADGDEEVVGEKVITKEDGVEVDVEIIKEDTGAPSSSDDEHDHEHVKRKTTTKIARTVQTKKIKQKVEKPEPPVRSVEWTPEVETETPAFPATFVFDPVQSREAVVTITVAAKDDEAEAEPVKEIEFPVSSLFQGKDLDQWYTITDATAAADEEENETAVEAEDEATTITEVVDDEAKEEAVEATEEASEETTEEAADEATEETAEAPVTEEASEETEAPVADETAATEETAADEVATEETEKETTEDAKVATDAKVEAEAEAKAAPAVTRFHVQATFVLSEIEALSLEAVNLSKKKQEAEAVLAILEREAASLRTKYERLNASQRSLGASSVSKPKSSLLLGGRTFAGQPAAPKSRYQKLKDSVSAVLTPQRQQVAISVAMFFGSAALFHFQGENLLA